MRNVDTMTERLAEARKHNAVSDDEARKALEVLRRDYWNDVSAVVADAINAIRSGEVSDEDALSDWLWSRLGNHPRTTYTHRARTTLLCSGSPDAYYDELDEADASDEVRAFYAMRADVTDRLLAESDDGTLGWFFEDAEDC